MEENYEELTKELETQHREIETALKRLESLIFEDELSAAEVGKQGKVLHDLLAKHFEFEENNEKFEEFAQESPQMRSAFDALYKEHKQLVEALGAACELATDSKEKDVRAAFQGFFTSLRRHKVREMDAIQKAYLTDIATGD